MGTPTPLDAFVESLKRSQGEQPDVLSTLRHIHAPARFDKPDAAKQRDELRDWSVTYSDGQPAIFSEIVVEPALPCRPIFWQSMNGQFHGPCLVFFVARMGPPGQYEFWLCVEEQERTVWIREDRLRSRHQVDVARRVQAAGEN